MMLGVITEDQDCPVMPKTIRTFSEKGEAS